MTRGLEGAEVLVTGAAGFLGSHIIPELVSRGAEVLALDLEPPLRGNPVLAMKGVRKAVADVRNLQALRSAVDQCSYVVHFAAIAAPRKCEEDPQLAFATNVQGTYNVLRLAKERSVKKILFSSSAHVYGISPKYMPTDEKHPLALQDTYTTSKILGESLCQLFYSNHNLEYIATRLFNSFGPGQSDDYFIPAMVSKAKTGNILLKGRSVTKDFVYVEDVIDAFCRALISDYVGEINIGSGTQTPLEVVARHIANAFGATLSFSDEGTGGPTYMQSDPSLARRILGWRSTTSLKKGLDLTIASARGRTNL